MVLSHISPELLYRHALRSAGFTRSMSCVSGSRDLRGHVTAWRLKLPSQQGHGLIHMSERTHVVSVFQEFIDCVRSIMLIFLFISFIRQCRLRDTPMREEVIRYICSRVYLRVKFPLKRRRFRKHRLFSGLCTGIEFSHLI